jgi:hypothetical protein
VITNIPVKRYIAEFSKDFYQYKKIYYVYVVKGNNTYNVTLDPIKVTITVHEPNPGGTVSPGPGAYNISPLETLTFNFSPQSNYKYYQKYTAGTWIGLSGFSLDVVNASESQISFKLRSGTNYGQEVGNFDFYPVFLCTSNPAASPNPPAQYPSATSEFNQKITRLFYSWYLPDNGGEQFSAGSMHIVNVPVNSRITLEAKWENATNTSGTYAGPFLKNYAIRWFIKSPATTSIIEIPQIISGSSKQGTGWSQAGLNIDQCGGYSAIAVLTGTLDGTNWYEIDRKSF